MQTIFKTGACLIPTCHTPDWIYSLYTISTSLGLPYLHNTHSTLGRVRSCPQTAQTDIRLQHHPRSPRSIFPVYPHLRSLADEPTPHDPRVAPSAPASSHKVPGSTTYSRLRQELMWAWSGYITPRAVSS